MQIRLNGETIDLEDGTTVAELIRSHGFAPERVAVEVNEELVARERRDATTLADGDRVELVTLVGGG